MSQHHVAAASHTVDRFLRLDDVKRATGLGRSTIYELMGQGLFPKAVKLVPGVVTTVRSSKAVGWSAQELSRWQEQRLAARDSGGK